MTQDIGKERVRVGDSYTNNGSNYGHMGPVINNGPRVARPEDVLADILKAVPKDKPILVHATIGDANTHSFVEGLRSLLSANGYTLHPGQQDMQVIGAPYHKGVQLQDGVNRVLYVGDVTL